MKDLEKLFENNHEWAIAHTYKDPNYFKKLAIEQKPEYLWIGCSDSRVPANDIVGLHPGELFVHRNIANVVVHTDLNCLSVIQYAVDILKVKHIVVCGHYGCGGIKAAMSHGQHGLLDNWLINIRNVYQKYNEVVDAKKSYDEKLDLLCELNVKEQVRNIAESPTVQNAWLNGDKLSVHGVIYKIDKGFLKDLKVTYSKVEDLLSLYRIQKD